MTLPVFIPTLPTTDQLAPYLRQIDKNKYYSNHGPLLKAFEKRLAAHFGVEERNLVTSCNGTIALTQMIKALDLPQGQKCLMPSWTFVATPAAALAAGIAPFFVDIDPATWCLSPETVRPFLKKEKIGAIVVVPPFGAPLDQRPWLKLQQETGVRVLVDAAAGFDSFSAAHRLSDILLPTMISLHATKAFGVGEGAIILCPTQDIKQNIFQWGNFGFFGSREAMIPGINAKLNEYAAAIGLAALDMWPTTRQRWQQQTETFLSFVSSCKGIKTQPNFGCGWISSYGNIQFTNGTEPLEISKSLKERGVDTVRWWGDGCHNQTAYRHFARSPMNFTDGLAASTLGLPFWCGLPKESYDDLFDRLKALLDNTPKTVEKQACVL